MNNSNRSIGGAALVAGLLVALFSARAPAQAVRDAPADGAKPPVLTYRGIVAGRSTVAELRAALGAPEHEALWYSWKMLYPAAGRAGLYDAFHLQSSQGDSGIVGTIEAASVPPGYETSKRVRAKLGPPEFSLELGRQSLADYAEHGLRFAFDADGATIGVAYFPRGYPRVHPGERRSLSLRHLPTRPPRQQNERPPSEIFCGAAQADITPREASWLGVEKIHVHDRLRVRAAVWVAGDEKVAIVGGDIFGMRRGDVVAVEKRLEEEHGVQLLLAMSHNHSSGDPLGLSLFYPGDYVKHIQEGVYSAVSEALGRLRPVSELRVAADELPLDGARVHGFFRNARNPGLLDPHIAAIQALDPELKPIVTLVHLACHVEGLKSESDEGLQISADFPGSLCDALAESTGAPTVFLNGALGGMVTGDTRARTHEEVVRVGKRLAGEFSRILRSAHRVVPSLELERSRLELPVTNPRMIALGKFSGRPSYRGRLVTEMFHLRLGSAEILTVPGELTPELSFEILARMPGFPRLILGLTNDQLGYILPGYDFRAGSYEESMSVGPVAGPMVLEHALRLVGAR